MFIRNIASLALLAGVATAQTTAADAPILSGAEGYYTYDCATHTLTQTPPTAQQATTGYLYNNSIGAINATPAWYVNNESGTVYVTSPGQIPASTSTAPFTGTMDRHTVSSYTFGYRTSELDISQGGPGTTVTLQFWDNMPSTCPTIAALGTPLYTETISGLPGTLVANTYRGIFFITVIPATQFRLNADSDQVFDNNFSLDDFGFSVQFTPLGTSTLAQPFSRVYGGGYLASATPTNQGDDTYYKNPAGVIAPYSATQSATGLGDHFWVLDWNGVTPNTGGSAAGCLWFGATPVQGQWGIYLQVQGLIDDCNGNLLPDDEDIQLGAADCDIDGVPDSCQPDCNGNSIADTCDISSATSADVNLNGIPDECECGTIANYCTSGLTTNGCVPVINGVGTPDSDAGSGFMINATSLEGLQSGILFYGLSSSGASWGGGSSSFLCVKSPLERMGVQSTFGTFGGCDGSMSIDWNAYYATNLGAVGHPYVTGLTCYAQAWFRDPPAPKTTSLSNGVSFVVCP